jgi:hypothetical protein
MTKLPVAAAPSAAVALPSVADFTAPMLAALCDALGAARSTLAADDQIEHAWANLPRLLARIPPQHRNETLVRMCVAVATGLFDSAINYAWNAAIVELREKVRRFGLAVVPQVIGRPFDETALLDLKDADLLQLCLELNLISEEGYFLLDQCRDIRNNFSAAHPVVGSLDEHEFIAFLNRCAKHALTNERNPVGVDIQAFIDAIKAGRFSGDQLGTWRKRVSDTFEAQRGALIGMLHGIYCDPASGEEARVSSLAICDHFKASLTPKVRSDLVDRHQEYKAKGDETRSKASQLFFEKLGMLGLLGNAEMHAIITNASANLLSVHNSFNNFYNEPPFAERLSSLTSQNRVPETAQYEFVSSVVTCAIGNGYGLSHAAMPYYEGMIRSFSPSEVSIMLSLPGSRTAVGNKIASLPSCKSNFARIVTLVDASSVPTPARHAYERWLKEGLPRTSR